jgi:MoaA/NifB/PqqE/SkfB family radical SAM enzyme
MPDLLLCQPVEQLTANLEALRQGIYGRIDQGRPTCCSRCMFMAPAEARAEAYRIRQINLGHNTRCNFKCRYCTTRKNMLQGSDGQVLRLMHGFAEKGMLNEELTFAWAGEGEPVLDPDFEGIMGLLLGKGAKGLIFTNASVHSQLIESGLAEGRLRTVTSLDAGTPKTFEQMHGVDAFDRVVANLKRYRADAYPDAISLKYILTPDNAREEETQEFVALCGRLGVRKVMISSDYSLAANPYPELTAQFRQQATEAGLEVTVTPWSA